MVAVNLVVVEVLGPEPPCPRCQTLLRTAENVASVLKADGVDVRTAKRNIMSREVVRQYGVLVSPALSVNGIVKVMGRVPSEAEVERLVREAAAEEL
ncbi:MAG: thioredoxin family protein [Candidatus Bathyarchaeia archaeon]